MAARVCPPRVTVPVNAGLTKGAYAIRLGIWLSVASVCPPRVGVPVNTGLCKGAYGVRLGILLTVARLCPPNVAVPVNAGLARGALLFSCVWILEETVLRYDISVGVAPANV